MQSSLDDCIGLGMDGTDTVSIHKQVTHLIAVGLTSRGTVESGGEDAFFKHEHTTHESPVTSTSFGNRISDLHEIRIPIWTHKRCLNLLANNYGAGVSGVALGGSVAGTTVRPS